MPRATVAWSTRGGAIESLDPSDASAAQELLESRFAAPESLSTVREHNTKLIRGIFHVHATGKTFHNYWTMSDLPVAERVPTRQRAFWDGTLRHASLTAL